MKIYYCSTVVLVIFSALSSSNGVHSGNADHSHHHKDLESEYSFKLVLRDGSYTLHWKFDLEAETIGFAVNVSTRGWVGFGLSPNGGMTGSDVVIGWVKDGSVHFNVSADLFFFCLKQNKLDKINYAAI